MKPSVTRTLTTRATPEQVFDFLSDWRTTESWDPGTITTTRTSGDGGVGTTYHNVSTFLGRRVEVTYVTLELEHPTRIHFRGTNEASESRDVFGIRATDAGTEVRYHAEFEFSSALVAPIVALYLPFLANKTMRKMQGPLDALAGPA